MAADKGNAIKWVATRKVDDYLEYLVSHTAWNPDKRFAKILSGILNLITILAQGAKTSTGSLCDG